MIKMNVDGEAGAVDIMRTAPSFDLDAHKGLNTRNDPTFPEIAKSRKKWVWKIKLADLSIAPPSAITANCDYFAEDNRFEIFPAMESHFCGL